MLLNSLPKEGKMISIQRASSINESCPDESCPVVGATLKEFPIDGCSFPLNVWVIEMTVEEAIKSFGKCVVSYKEDLGLFHVLIYDDYIE